MKADRSAVAPAPEPEIMSLHTCSSTSKGWTPLHYATSWGREEVVRVLLQHGGDVHSKSDDGRTPEDLASLEVASLGESRPYFQIAAMLKAEAVRRAKCEAFAMGMHARLGVGSRVLELDEGVVRMVLEQV